MSAPPSEQALEAVLGKLTLQPEADTSADRPAVPSMAVLRSDSAWMQAEPSLAKEQRAPAFWEWRALPVPQLWAARRRLASAPALRELG